MLISRERPLLPLAGALLLCACGAEPGAPLPGTLEWTRIDVLAEVSEPVIALNVTEGEPVEAGEVLLRLDPRRTDARLAAAHADARRLMARLEE
ncbi:biotin/lipoyl-binding protein, partial [Acinetobacter baumannii]|uniref:biotin/lipoyl-binding protein n=1 Tax=Acinetobacter baumannii TaxID=470 RepID=UPI00189BC219